MVYFEIPWYQMPVSFQKQILSAIHDVQNGPVLTMGPLDELDFEMAASVRAYFIHNFIHNFSLTHFHIKSFFSSTFSLHDKFIDLR